MIHATFCRVLSYPHPYDWFPIRKQLLSNCCRLLPLNPLTCFRLLQHPSHYHITRRASSCKNINPTCSFLTRTGDRRKWRFSFSFYKNRIMVFFFVRICRTSKFIINYQRDYKSREICNIWIVNNKPAVLRVCLKSHVKLFRMNSFWIFYTE